MTQIDLFKMRSDFSDSEIMICFNGPFSRSIIEELGHAIKRYMEAEPAEKSAMTDVFSVFIEQTQNIRNYSSAKACAERDQQYWCSAIVVIAKDAGRYLVSSGNVVDNVDLPRLVGQVDMLQGLDKAALKAMYKEQLRKPRQDGLDTGAGLGLIDMARKSSEPISCFVRPIDAERSFFSLKTVI